MAAGDIRHKTLSTDGPRAPRSGGFERNEESEAVVDVKNDTPGALTLSFRYALRGRPENSPWIGLYLPAGPDLQRFDRLTFSARADRPMRVWVQLRTPDSGGPLYWQRSVYVDSTRRDVTVRFDDMRPLGGRTATQGAPELERAEAILFVIDQTHTPIGRAGRVWLDDIRYAR